MCCREKKLLSEKIFIAREKNVNKKFCLKNIFVKNKFPLEQICGHKNILLKKIAVGRYIGARRKKIKEKNLS